MKDFSPENQTAPNPLSEDYQSAIASESLWKEAWHSAEPTIYRDEKLQITQASQWSYSIDFNAKEYLERQTERQKASRSQQDNLADALKESPENRYIKVQSGSQWQEKASPAFQRKMEMAVNDLPAEMKKLIAENNVKITTTPEGGVSSPGSTGTYDVALNEINLSERSLSKHPDDVNRTIYELLAYALDGKKLKVSSDREFRNALIEDIKFADAKAKSYFNSEFKHSTAYGYSQIHAKVFTQRQLEKGGQAIDEHTQRAYPNALAYMRKKYPDMK